MTLDGNTILVTGGTSGIGRELAAQLLHRGNTVLAQTRQVHPGSPPPASR